MNFWRRHESNLLIRSRLLLISRQIKRAHEILISRRPKQITFLHKTTFWWLSFKRWKPLFGNFIKCFMYTITLFATPHRKKKAQTKRQNLGYQNELKATGNKITPSIPRDRSAFITCVSLPLTVNVAGLLSPRTLVLSFLVTTQLYEPRSKTCTLVISNVPSSLTVNRGSESVLIVSLSFFQWYCKTLLSYVAEHRNVTVLPVSTVCEVGCVSHTRVDCELLSDEPVRKRIVRNVFQFTKSTLTSKIELFSSAVVMLYKHTQATRWTIMKVPT